MDDNTIAIQYSKDYLVVQANELVRSRQEDLTLLEAKLIRLVISQVVAQDTDLLTYTCNVIDLAKFLGISQDNIYRDIDSVSDGLMKKLIYIPIKNHGRRSQYNYEKIQWVSKCRYTDGKITIKLHPDLKPYLVGLDELFTMYSYEALIRLPTNNSIRLYELLSSWINTTVRDGYRPCDDMLLDKNEISFTIDYLREFFNCTDKYPNAGDFIINVIDRSVKAIQKHTLMKVSYRKVKQGRNIGHIVFKLNDFEPTEEWKNKLRQIDSVMEQYKSTNKHGDFV